MFREEQKHDKNFFISSYVYIDNSTIEGAGIGCFTSKDIPARMIIECSPVVLCHADTFTHLNHLHNVRHILSDYSFKWTESGLAAFPLGWGGVYNHSFDPNVHWKYCTEEKDGYNALTFRTLRNVNAGEELFIRYMNDSDRLWFADDSVDPLATTKYKTGRQMKSMAKSRLGMSFFGDLKGEVEKREKRNQITNTLGSLSTLGKKDDD